MLLRPLVETSERGFAVDRAWAGVIAEINGVGLDVGDVRASRRAYFGDLEVVGAGIGGGGKDAGRGDSKQDRTHLSVPEAHPKTLADIS